MSTVRNLETADVLARAWNDVGPGSWPQLTIEQGRVHSIFVWGRAQGEEQEVLPLAAQLYQQTGAVIVLPGYEGVKKGQGKTGYAGAYEWCSRLYDKSVPGAATSSTSGHAPVQQTKVEFEEFIDWLRRGESKPSLPILVVTTVVHVVRAMLGVVASLRQHSREDLMVLPVWAQDIDLNRSVYGSQGKGPQCYYKWIPEEVKRIHAYQEKGDLATLDELREYMERNQRWLGKNYPTPKMAVQNYIREHGASFAKLLR